MTNHWEYIHSNLIWYAWYFDEEEYKVKLGPFDTMTEARKAVEQYENSNK